MYELKKRIFDILIGNMSVIVFFNSQLMCK